ncbi:replication protein [Tepidanaerobacter syntrophicus]|uniref:replication protein n=1 Tax=Tepidanaerobacter syntrophicus TaxID=224999 RepID=UPI001BD40495|nr:replication protein [Tepidanaerobacter syntrophicus]
MNGPQLEGGYTRIANEILERISTMPLNGTQFRILMVIWRYTYGFNRKEHELSQNFIAEASSLSERQVRRELKRLVEMKIINVVKEATFSSARVLAFNKYFDTWRINQTTEDKLDHSTEDKLDHSPPDGLDPQERQYKDNIKDSTTPLPPPEENCGGGDFENNEEEPDEPKEIGEVYDFYQNNFGTISPFIAQKIGDMVDAIGPAMVVEAMKIAITNGARRLNYVEAIIERWVATNIRSPADIVQDEERHKQNTKNSDLDSFRNAKNISKPPDIKKLEEQFREVLG